MPEIKRWTIRVTVEVEMSGVESPGTLVDRVLEPISAVKVDGGASYPKALKVVKAESIRIG